MRKDFLGRGWSFPFSFDPVHGGVSVSEFEENIRQSITVILGTKPGERQMVPEFGCKIHEMMFAPDTRATASMVAHHVEEALLRWEPRIDLEKVDAWSDGSGTLKVEVHYKIRSTLSDQQVSLEFSGK